MPTGTSATIQVHDVLRLGVEELLVSQYLYGSGVSTSSVPLSPVDLSSRFDFTHDALWVKLKCVTAGDLWILPIAVAEPVRLLVHAHPDHPFFRFMDGAVIQLAAMMMPQYVGTTCLCPRTPVVLNFVVTKSDIHNSTRLTRIFR